MVYCNSCLARERETFTMMFLADFAVAASSGQTDRPRFAPCGLYNDFYHVGPKHIAGREISDSTFVSASSTQHRISW